MSVRTSSRITPVTTAPTLTAHYLEMLLTEACADLQSMAATPFRADAATLQAAGQSIEAIRTALGYFAPAASNSTHLSLCRRAICASCALPRGLGAPHQLTHRNPDKPGSHYKRE